MSDLQEILRKDEEAGKGNVTENVENDPQKSETEEEDERELPEWMLRKLQARKGEGSLTVIDTNGSTASKSQSIDKNENINKKNNDMLANIEETSKPTPINREDSQHANDNSGTMLAAAEADDEASAVTPTQQKRTPCKYGEQCYRRNPAHKAEYSHPGDEDYSSEPEQDAVQPSTSADATDSRPECEYGTSCYRQNPQHKRDFKHTQPPAQPAATADSPKAKKTRQPAKRKRKADDDEYESEGDNEYDLNDSFLEDSGEEEEEEKEDEEDDDYVPDKEDPELLDENQWKETEEDSPEVLELLKEARDYLRNKKLHK